MKSLECKYCGSHDFNQVGDYFICQYCKSQYLSCQIDDRTEPKSKAFVEKPLKVDNLYKLARLANDHGHNQEALKHYTSILEKDPNSWEALFYTNSLSVEVESNDISSISSLATSMTNSLYPTFNLLKMSVTDEHEVSELVTEICNKTISIANILETKATKNYLKDDERTRGKFVQSYANNIYNTTQMLYVLGDNLISLFQDTYAIIAIQAWKKGVAMHVVLVNVLISLRENTRIINSYEKKIKKYDSIYKAPKIEKLFQRQVKSFFKSCFSIIKRFIIFIIVIHLLLLLLYLLL